MPVVMQKVLADLFLRKDPAAASGIVALDGTPLQVFAGEVVMAGAKDNKDEVVNGKTVTWAFVEATAGRDVEKRKGYISNRFLGAEDERVESSEAFQPFRAEVSREDFATTCLVHAELQETNPAYLFALAFALSGDKWIAPHVKTNDPAGAPALGVFRFTQVTWDALRMLPELSDLTAAQIKFPTAQCVVAAVLAAKSASLLKGLITDRALSAVDLYLAHLFADDNSFGSNAAAAILQAEKDDRNKLSGEVIKQIYKDDAPRATAFMARNDAIFKAGGAATIEQALAACADKIAAGFKEVEKLAAEIIASIPSDARGPIFSGQFQGKVIEVTDRDVEALGRVAHSEVGNFGKFGNQVLTDALAAVVDTIFNRVAYHTSEFPDTIQGVIDAPKQFSAINPPSIGTWKNLPQATTTNQAIVLAHVQARARGAASKIKGAMHFFNPDTSNPSWGGPVKANPVAKYGIPDDSHVHGFPNGYRAPEAHAIKFGQDVAVFSGDGQPQGQLPSEDSSSKSIVAAALKEWNFWGKSVPQHIGHRDDEADFAIYVRDTYCKALSIDLPTLSAIRNDQYAWSAVTISYILRQAGIFAPAITLSQRHSTYIREAVKARKNNDGSKMYWGFRITEPGAALAPGDIIGCMRTSGMSHATAQTFFDATEDYESHTDIVVAVRSGKADVIGGNVSDSVTMKTIDLDSSGKIADQSNLWFVVMKKRG